MRAENRRVMLANERRRTLHLTWSFRKDEGRIGNLHPAKHRMLDFSDHAARSDVRVIKCLAHIKNRCAGNAGFRQRVQGGVIAREGLEPGFDHGDEFVPVFEPLRIRPELRIRHQVFSAHGFCQLGELMLHRLEHDIALFAFEDAEGCNPEVVRAKALRVLLTVCEGVEGNVDHIHEEERIDLGDIDQLAFAATVPIEQRRTHRQGGMHAGVGISNIIADVLGRAVRVAGHVHDAAHGLSDNVVTGVLR